MELKTYLSVLARRWWIVLLITGALGAAAFYGSKYIPPRYRADIDLRVTTPIGGSLGDISYQTYYAERLMSTYASLATSDPVLSAVKQKLGLAKLPEISVKIIPDSELIQVSVVGSDPRLAAMTANALAAEVINQSQVNNNGSNGEDLAILTQRQAGLDQDLVDTKQSYANLSKDYASTTAQMAVVNQNIQLDEARYQSLQDQYNQAALDEGLATTVLGRTQAQATKNLLGGQIDELKTGLDRQKQDYLALSTRSIEVSQQLAGLSQTIQAKEKANLDLLSQIDAARIAGTKHNTAQSLLIASPAVVPGTSSSPSRMMVTGLGVLVGLIAGVVLGFLIDALDNRIRSIAQIEQITSARILGRVPILSRKDRRAPQKSPNGVVQQAFWTLSIKLQGLQAGPLHKVLVTSADPSEGKSTVVMGLSAGLAKAGRAVLVIDGDLYKPKQHRLFGIDREPGLAEYLEGQVTLRDAVHPTQVPGVDLLPSGLAIETPGDLLDPTRLSTLMEQTAPYDMILFDSPSLLALPDASRLGRVADGAVLVVRFGRTTADSLRIACQQVEDAGLNLLGIVVSGMPVKQLSPYRSYYRSAYRPSLFGPKPARHQQPDEGSAPAVAHPHG